MAITGLVSFGMSAKVADSFTTFLNPFADTIGMVYVTCLIVVGFHYREQLRQFFLEYERNYDLENFNRKINSTSID